MTDSRQIEQQAADWLVRRDTGDWTPHDQQVLEADDAAGILDHADDLVAAGALRFEDLVIRVPAPTDSDSTTTVA